MADPVQVQTGPTGAVVEHAETVQTALVEQDTDGHHTAAVTWLGFDSAGWVAVAMLILIGIMIWKKVPQAIGRALDGYTAKVKAELDEASRLRAEAEALLASYQAEANEAAEASKKIAAHARAEATAEEEHTSELQSLKR